MPKLSIEEVLGLQNEGGLNLQQIGYVQQIVLHWKRLEKKEIIPAVKPKPFIPPIVQPVVPLTSPIPNTTSSNTHEEEPNIIDAAKKPSFAEIKKLWQPSQDVFMNPEFVPPETWDTPRYDKEGDEIDEPMPLFRGCPAGELSDVECPDLKDYGKETDINLGATYEELVTPGTPIGWIYVQKHFTKSAYLRWNDAGGSRRRNPKKIAIKEVKKKVYTPEEYQEKLKQEAIDDEKRMSEILLKEVEAKRLEMKKPQE